MSQRTVQQAFELAKQHHQAGRLAEAEALYGQVLLQEPEHAGALQHLGIIAQQRGQSAVAVDLIGRAIAARADVPEAHYNLGIALNDLGRREEAIACFRQAIVLRPQYARAMINLGNALKDGGQLAEAMAAYQHVVEIKPHVAEAHFNLGVVFKDQGRIEEAIAAWRQAIALNPAYAEALMNLANALQAKGQLEEAVLLCHRAIAARPDLVEAYYNLGNVLKDGLRLEEAVAAYRRALALQPDHADCHFNLGWTLLLGGDLPAGWPEYEWRWKSCEQVPPRSYPRPLWSGQELAGKTILIHAEQGAGDIIQFLRYVPLLGQRGANVLLGFSPDLKRIASRVTGVGGFVERGQTLPPFDFHLPLLTLPMIFGTTVETIPANVPYLTAEPELVDFWRQKSELSRPGLKVALTWAGNPEFKGDQTRSLSLDRVAPLREVAGVSFYSIQKGAAAAQADQPPAGLQLTNLAAQIGDFADTAAVMELMDLVITSDTSVAHLAGALGRPVWVMLQYSPDWRWLLHRSDSPWYPTMRLFRQKTPGDWPGVIARVGSALAVLADAQRLAVI